MPGTDDLEIGYPNRSIAHHENDLKLSPANDASFKEAFYRKIFPLIQAVAQYYKDTLPNETLFSFGKQVFVKGDRTLKVKQLNRISRLLTKLYPKIFRFV